MHILDAAQLRSAYFLDSNHDGLSINYLSSDVDDQLASQTQMQFSTSARSSTQEQFRIVAENLEDAGTILYLFG